MQGEYIYMFLLKNRWRVLSLVFLKKNNIGFFQNANKTHRQLSLYFFFVVP